MDQDGKWKPPFPPIARRERGPAPRYSLEAGRCILRDGKMLATLHGVQPYDPVEVDELAAEIVRLLNK